MTENQLHPGFQPNVIAIVGNTRRDSRSVRLSLRVLPTMAMTLG